jgi:hypothetical protein
VNLPVRADGDHEDQHVEKGGDHRGGHRLHPHLLKAPDLALI